MMKKINEAYTVLNRSLLGPVPFLEEVSNTIKEVNGFYDIKERIEKLKENNNVSLDSLIRIRELEKALLDGKDLSLIEHELEKIEKATLQIAELKKQRVELNRMYMGLIDKANNLLKTLNPKDSGLMFNYINASILRIANIYKLGYDNLVNADVLSLLEQISFSAMDIDDSILTLIENNLNLELNVNNLFIKNGDKEHIYMILEVGETIKLAKWSLGSGAVFEEVSKKTLQEDYRPLDDFLDDKHLIWKVGDYPFGRIYFLYSIGVNSNDGFLILYVDRQDASFKKVTIMPSSVNIEYNSKIHDKDMEKWKNPEYLKQKIGEQIKLAMKDDYPRERKK